MPRPDAAPRAAFAVGVLQPVATLRHLVESHVRRRDDLFELGGEHEGLEVHLQRVRRATGDGVGEPLDDVSLFGELGDRLVGDASPPRTPRRAGPRVARPRCAAAMAARHSAGSELQRRLGRGDVDRRLRAACRARARGASASATRALRRALEASHRVAPGRAASRSAAVTASARPRRARRRSVPRGRRESHPPRRGGPRRCAAPPRKPGRARFGASASAMRAATEPNSARAAAIVAVAASIA